MRLGRCLALGPVPSHQLSVNSRELLTAAGIYQMITRRSHQAGIGLYPHRFRHHFSHTWLDHGGPEGDLMELYGWTSNRPWGPSGSRRVSSRSFSTHGCDARTDHASRVAKPGIKI